MNALVGCEFSGIVRDAFKAKGWDAWSCDLLPTERPGQHFQEDLRRAIWRRNWDLLIAHPPCTYLAASGARWWKDRKKEQTEAIIFFKWLLYDCRKIARKCIENPVGIISSVLEKPSQIIQPWQFGESFQKTTCLWLKNLPLLRPTKIVDRGEFVIHGGKKLPKWYSNRERNRSKTFEGIAKAMAEQWTPQSQSRGAEL